MLGAVNAKRGVYHTTKSERKHGAAEIERRKTSALFALAISHPSPHLPAGWYSVEADLRIQASHSAEGCSLVICTTRTSPSWGHRTIGGDCRAGVQLAREEGGEGRRLAKFPGELEGWQNKMFRMTAS